MSKRLKNESNNFLVKDEEYMKRKEVLTSFFSDGNYMLMTFKQIKGLFNITKKEEHILASILDELEKEGIVYIDDSKRYVPVGSSNMFFGIYEAKSSKFGFIRLDSGDDIYIAKEDSLGAMNNDKVIVKLISNNTADKNAEGSVIKIVERGMNGFVGKFVKSRNFGFVQVLDKKTEDIYIPKKYAQSFKDGQVVRVEITKYPTLNNKAEGKIVEVIAENDEENLEVKALYAAYEIKENQKFSDAVMNEVKKINQEVLPSDFKNREDKTSERVVTIDGDDAKDLDDGVCVKKLNDGNYLLSVFIADVSHYVKDGSALDMEAVTRSTSVYIPSTVVPMLPKELSNGICSLNEGVDRLTLAIDMKITPTGEVIDSKIYKAVINVKKRMTYDKVYKVLSLEDMDTLKEYKEYEKDLFLMKELALILNKKRKKQGSIDFDISETKVVLDENGNVEDIKPYKITIANKIIEEFMLIANMQIAEKFYYLDLPFIYRIHEKPDEDKLRDLNEVLSGYGKRIKGIKNVHPKTLADILSSITDVEEKQVISSYMLRALKLARYSKECIGHFGLAAKFYCHFTSPIRRYPDLFIHRVISDYIASGYNIDLDRIKKYLSQAERYSKIASDMEKEATLIERDFDNLYIVIYMSKFIDEKFDAIVSSVNSFGMFVRLENTVEGLVPFNNMPNNDYYIYDEKRKTLVGRNTGRIFKVGDRLKVQLTRSDVSTRQIDFKVIEEEEYGEESKQEKRTSKKGRKSKRDEQENTEE